MKYLIPLFFLSALPAMAEAPEIVVATAMAAPDGTTFRFGVTLRHPDTGWEHYADTWQIEAPDGTVLGVRKLDHPHEEEQPFTRSLSGVVVPEGLTRVRVRAHCLVDGWSRNTYVLTIR